MKERPILFSGSMVRRILDGGKTQTRRIAKAGIEHERFRVPVTIGTILWVRESWSGPYRYADMKPRDMGGPFWYWADGNPADGDWTRPKPSIHMPRHASRISLLVKNVRVERLQGITCADAIAEGIRPAANSQTIDCDTPDPRQEFARLWEGINGPGSWDANPWVAVIEFERIKTERKAA